MYVQIGVVELVSIFGALFAVIGFLGGWLLTLLMATPYKQKLLDHVDECIRFRETVSEQMSDLKETIDKIREGVAGLYRK